MSERSDEQPRVIAIVDDDDAVRDSIRFLLEMAGYSVRVYDSPRRLLANGWGDLDCLVIDQHMPGATGLEVLTRLRDDNAHLPAVLITGSTSTDLERRAAELGARLLVKPLVEDDLLGLLNSLLE